MIGVDNGVCVWNVCVCVVIFSFVARNDQEEGGGNNEFDKDVWADEDVQIAEGQFSFL